MKQPILLKTILDIAFIMLVFGFLSGLGLAIYYIFAGDVSLPLTINEMEINKITPAVKVLLVTEFLISALFLYTIYLLRKLVRDFFRNKLFTRLQISLLNLIGQLIILITLAQVATNFIGGIFVEDEVSIGIKLSSDFGSFWFALAIGLFFIYLSRLFEQARKLKEENELTV